MDILLDLKSYRIEIPEIFFFKYLYSKSQKSRSLLSLLEDSTSTNIKATSNWQVSENNATIETFVHFAIVLIVSSRFQKDKNK